MQRVTAGFFVLMQFITLPFQYETRSRDAIRITSNLRAHERTVRFIGLRLAVAEHDVRWISVTIRRDNRNDRAAHIRYIRFKAFAIGQRVKFRDSAVLQREKVPHLHFLCLFLLDCRARTKQQRRKTQRHHGNNLSVFHHSVLSFFNIFI